MKKLVAAAAFGALIVGGFAAVQDAPVDTTMEWEPRILSVEQDVSQF